MAKVDKEVWIEAPIERIFSYISEPSNLPEFWPSLIEIRDVQSLPDGGYKARWVYKMLGMRFEGSAEYTQIVPNQFFVIETKGGINSTTFSWLSYRVEYADSFFHHIRDTTAVISIIQSSTSPSKA